MHCCVESISVLKVHVKTHALLLGYTGYLIKFRHCSYLKYTMYIHIHAGGSEKFQDKQTFFYTELKKHHSKYSRNDLRVVISRYKLLESVSIHSSAMYRLVSAVYFVHLMGIKCDNVFIDFPGP